MLTENQDCPISKEEYEALNAKMQNVAKEMKLWEVPKLVVFVSDVSDAKSTGTELRISTGMLASMNPKELGMVMARELNRKSAFLVQQQT